MSKTFALDIDECGSNPCQNNGRCTTPVHNDYLCTCEGLKEDEGGWIGKKCEKGEDIFTNTEYERLFV